MFSGTWLLILYPMAVQGRMEFHFLGLFARATPRIFFKQPLDYRFRIAERRSFQTIYCFGQGDQLTPGGLIEDTEGGFP